MENAFHASSRQELHNNYQISSIAVYPRNDGSFSEDLTNIFVYVNGQEICKSCIRNRTNR
eukprot:4614728-Amphidinium_carterae.2